MDDIQSISKAAAERHPDDIEKAVDDAVERIRKLKEFPKLVDELVRSAVRHVVSDCRHTANVAMKLAAGEYGGPAKVTAGKATDRVAQNYYAYFIGGRTLGSITGDELEDIAASEANRAKGHEFNSRLCLRLKPFVAKGKTVRECVKPAKLASLFKDIQETDAA
jgi:hypothetical protein